MKIVNYTNKKQVQEFLTRSNKISPSTYRVAKNIVNEVRTDGDSALVKLSKSFDPKPVKSFKVTDAEIQRAKSQVDRQFMRAIRLAIRNQNKFQKSLLNKKLSVVDTMPGVKVWREWRAATCR